MYPGFNDYSAPTNVNLGVTPNPTDSPSSFGATPMGINTNPGSINYSNNTSEYMRLLSATERRNLEIPREIYVSIKMLDVLEKALTFGKIQETEHYAKAQTLLPRMEKLINMLYKSEVNLGLFESFIQEYGLTECTWARDALKKYLNKGDNPGVPGLVASVTSGFIRLPDYFFIHDGTAQVKDVLPMLQEMKQLLDKLRPHFSKPGQPFNLGDRYVPLITKLSNMGLNDVLNKDLVNEIVDVNDFAKNTFQIHLR